MSKRKKHGDHEEHPSEAWLVPYADILTLLLALFIVLFATSSGVDEEKYEAIMQSFYGIFNGDLPTPASGTGMGLGDSELPSIDDIFKSLTPPENASEGTEGEGEGEGEEGTGEEGNGGKLDANLQGIYNNILAYIDEKNLHDSVGVKIISESVLITLTNDIWFLPGSARVSEEMKSVADAIAEMFVGIQDASEKELSIVITGHTDNVPMNNAEFRSNWHLSVYRAVNFMEILMETSELDERIFSARGYGEQEPIDTNDTIEGRMHNRRVEVQVMYRSDINLNGEHDDAEPPTDITADDTAGGDVTDTEEAVTTQVPTEEIANDSE